MKSVMRIILCATLGCGAFASARAWSVKSSSKAHVRVLVVDDEANPIQGQKVTFRLKSGGGKEICFLSDKDGMISFRDDIGAYAICQFDLDRKVYYPVWFEFRNYQSGSIVTGVVKRVVAPSRMVDMHIRGAVSNDVNKVGLDLMRGDLVHPYGKGKHADLYMTIKTWRDESVQTSADWKKNYSQYGFARFDSPSEFTIIDKDIGCELPTPAFAPETMLNNSNVVFNVDYRPGSPDAERVGKGKYVIVKVVRPQGVFFGVIVGGLLHHYHKTGEILCDLMYSINVNNGNRNIVWKNARYNSTAWQEQVKAWYAEEDAENEKATSKNLEMKK